jgi:hypothetical protein
VIQSKNGSRRDNDRSEKEMRDANMYGRVVFVKFIVVSLSDNSYFIFTQFVQANYILTLPSLQQPLDHDEST